MKSNLFTAFIFTVIICVCGYILYDIGYKRGRFSGFKEGNLKGFKKGELIGYKRGKNQNFKSNFDSVITTYLDSRNDIYLRNTPFQSSTDYDKLIDLLALIKQNPSQYNLEQFYHEIFIINSDILNHLSKVYGFSEQQKNLLYASYSKFHNKEIISKYYSNFLAINQDINIKGSNTAEQLISKPIILYDSYVSSTNFSKSLSSITCGLFDLFFGLVKLNPEMSFASQLFGITCEIFLKDILLIIDRNLKYTSLTKDINMSKFIITSQIRKTASKIISIEDIITSKLDRTKMGSILGGFFYTKTSLQFNINSKIAAGVDLNEYYNVDFDHTSKNIIVTLAQPKILSNEANYTIDAMYEGLFEDVTNEMINLALEEGKNQNTTRAINSNILGRAKINIQQTFKTFIEPMLNHPAGRYSLRVKFLGE